MVDLKKILNLLQLKKQVSETNEVLIKSTINIAVDLLLKF
jgi:hypothetical protein